MAHHRQDEPTEDGVRKIMRLRTTGAVAGVATATALSLAACTGSGPSEANTEPTDALTIATTSNNQAPMEAVADAYREKTGLDVNVTIADRSEEHTSELQSRGHIV